MFELATWTAAKVLHINKRVEMRGQEPVHAKDIKWSIKVPNTMLDKWFGAELRNALWSAKDTATLDGVDPITPDLRTDMLKPPFAVKREFSGYLLTIKRQSGRKNIELAGVEVNAIRLTPIDGGSCELIFRTQVSGLDADTLGRIDEIDGHEVELMAIPPALQEGTLPDSVSPFKHSVVDGAVVDNNPPPPLEAGDMFAVAHGASNAEAKPEVEQTKPPASFKAKAKLAMKAAAKKQKPGQAARP